ncbi:12009_t:CDS:2, partial [Dentiscutata heterogama]
QTNFFFQVLYTFAQRVNPEKISSDHKTMNVLLFVNKIFCGCKPIKIKWNDLESISIFGNVPDCIGQRKFFWTVTQRRFTNSNLFTQSVNVYGFFFALGCEINLTLGEIPSNRANYYYECNTGFYLWLRLWFNRIKQDTKDIPARDGELRLRDSCYFSDRMFFISNSSCSQDTSTVRFFIDTTYAFVKIYVVGLLPIIAIRKILIHESVRINTAPSLAEDLKILFSKKRAYIIPLIYIISAVSIGSTFFDTISNDHERKRALLLYPGDKE